MVGAVRHSLRAGGWGAAASAAALGFLAVLGVGAAFIGVLKIYDPAFGADRSPPWVLVRIVIAGLASLGIPIEQAGAEGTILPLGALAFVGWTLVWATRNTVAKSHAASAGERLVQGAKTGLPFALIAFVAAIVFRVRDFVDVGADPGLALLLGGFWGALFGAIGGATTMGKLRTVVSEVAGFPRHEVVSEGVGAAALMLITGAALASAAVLLGLIVDLAAGSGMGLSAGDALAIVFILVVFGPNIVAGTLAFATGAPVVFVAQSLGIEVFSEFSLIGWGAGGPDAYFYLLLLIPLIACLLGGYAARRRVSDPRRFLEVVGIAACVFSVLLAVLAYLGGISLDRAFLGEGNLFVMSADSAAAFFLAFLWAAAAGAAGWKVAESQIETDDEHGRRVG
jgi:hypothetical protein